jgi:hypothetical protein
MIFAPLSGGRDLVIPPSNFSRVDRWDRLNEADIELLVRSLRKRLKAVGCDVPDGPWLDRWERQRVASELRKMGVMREEKVA